MHGKVTKANVDLEVVAARSCIYSEFHGYCDYLRHGAGLLGFLGILVQYLLRQNAQRHNEHAVAMGAIYDQGLRMQKLHTATSELIQQNALAAHQHSNELHREAMGAMAAQGLRMEKLHTRTMDAVAALDRERIAEVDS